ncbi:MAG: hypothetical protein ABSE80_11245 [Halobacteriota archaeon]
MKRFFIAFALTVLAVSALIPAKIALADESVNNNSSACSSGGVGCDGKGR